MCIYIYIYIYIIDIYRERERGRERERERERVLEYGVRAPVSYGNLHGANGRKRLATHTYTNNVFSSYRKSPKSPETSGSFRENVINLGILYFSSLLDCFRTPGRSLSDPPHPRQISHASKVSSIRTEISRGKARLMLTVQYEYKLWKHCLSIHENKSTHSKHVHMLLYRARAGYALRLSYP